MFAVTFATLRNMHVRKTSNYLFTHSLAEIIVAVTFGSFV